ncbi:MAG: dTDP-4-dehydrorhamnose reductase [Rhodocyclaceae bacterium]|nr:MAG: dTDP-4-dehydrorhamnose reductase [Rhodocyclaceae bacterium]
MARDVRGFVWPKILLLGCDGQVGWALQRALAPLGDVVALNRSGEGGCCGDLAEPVDLSRTVRKLAPDVIVNAAAYTAVDKAESEVSTAMAVNAVAPGVLAREAALLGSLLVHYSTDYVFDGSGSHPWHEDHVPSPLSVYGRSKLAGEEMIRAVGGRHLIFRTSWVFATQGGNFAKTMLRLATERDRLSVVADQIGAPTSADLVADITAHALRAALAEPSLSGTYHLAASGETSWHGYARYVLECAEEMGHALKVLPHQVEAIPSADYPLPARRPLNSRLQTQRLRATFGVELPDWRHGVRRMISEVLSNKP